MFPSYQVSSTTDIHEPAAATAAIVTYVAKPAFSHIISGVTWSYSAAPASGGLTIEDGSGNKILSISITAAGPGTLHFEPAKQGTLNTAMIITLASGGGTVVGKINVNGHWTRQPLNS